MTRVLADAGASVKDIFHERAWLQSSVDEVVIRAVLETRGPAHNAALLAALHRAGHASAVISGGA